MPYIITTRRETPGIIAHDIAPRRAVATLEEAQDCADERVIATFDGLKPPHPLAAKEWLDTEYRYREAARHLSEAGGSIGPLPDGTRIDVQQT